MAQMAAVAHELGGARTRTSRKPAVMVLGAIALAVVIVVSILGSVSSKPAAAVHPSTDARLSALQSFHADAAARHTFSDAEKLQALQRLKAGK